MITYILAQIIGLYLFIVGIAMLTAPNRFKAALKDFLGNKALFMYSGLIAIIYGLIIVVIHNFWISDWPVIITIVGWIFLIKGLLRLFYTENIMAYSKKAYSKEGFLWISWILIIVGGYLGYMGFFS